jgi:hypothetical protein
MRTRQQALALLVSDAKAAGLDLSLLATDEVLCEDSRTIMIYAGDHFARWYEVKPKGHLSLVRL